MTGEPFDFGESAMLPSLAEPGFVAAPSLDVNGTYSFANQQDAFEDNIICLIVSIKRTHILSLCALSPAWRHLTA